MGVGFCNRWLGVRILRCAHYKGDAVLDFLMIMYIEFLLVGI